MLLFIFCPCLFFPSYFGVFLLPLYSFSLNMSFLRCHHSVYRPSNGECCNSVSFLFSFFKSKDIVHFMFICKAAFSLLATYVYFVFFLKSVRCYHMMYTKSYEPPVNFWKIFKKYRACAWATDLKVQGDQLLRRQFDPPHRKRVLVSIGIAMLEQFCNALLC